MEGRYVLYGAATICAEQILSAYDFTIYIFCVLQIILIVVLPKFEVDSCSYKVGLTFDRLLFQ